MNYILSEIPNVFEIVKGNNASIDDKYLNVHNYHLSENRNYTIIKYNKTMLSSDLVHSYGLLKSVIVSDKIRKVVGFSPPKSMSCDLFMKRYPVISTPIIAEDFIEGTMINLFYDPGHSEWQISTRNTVGANMSFYSGSAVTFNDMWKEACLYNNLDATKLNKSYCYSFVLQHPENRIVAAFKTPQLYLVGVFEIKQTDDSLVVTEHLLSNIRVTQDIWSHTSVRFPTIHECHSYTELIEKFASSATTPYNIMGVRIKNTDTGETTKIRNPNYEQVRQLKGNHSKAQYQYLTLRQSGKVSEYLKFYPEEKSQMSKFRDEVHIFTNNLHKNYVSCYVMKEQELKYYPTQYRTHMYKLHQHYIDNLRPKKLGITNTEVIKYVNTLPPALLMYCLNYNLRKKAIDNIKAEGS